MKLKKVCILTGKTKNKKGERKMFTRIISFLLGDKKKRLKKQIDSKYKQAIEYQRNGNIRKYSELMNEISSLEDEYNDEKID